MAHDEFPPLMDAGRNVLAVAFHKIDVSKPCWDRRFAAAVIREAVKRAVPFHSSTLQVVTVADLLRIAENLHSPPPPPPTREQMEATLNRLWPLLGCQPGSKGDEYMQTLRRGIAHHCMEQP